MMSTIAKYIEKTKDRYKNDIDFDLINHLHHGITVHQYFIGVRDRTFPQLSIEF